MASNDAFIAKLRETFKVEAGEHLQAISKGLFELEKTPASGTQGKIAEKAGEARQKTIEAVFRAAHSLKGAARAVDFTEIESLCQLLEDVFALWKKTERIPSPEALDTLHGALDAANSMLAGPPGAGNYKSTPSLRQSLRQLASPVPTLFTSSSPTLRSTDKSSKAAKGHTSKATETVSSTSALENISAYPAATEKKVKPEETVRVAISKLETRLLESEEMLMVKLIADQRAVDLQQLGQHFEGWRNEWATIEPDVRKLRQSRERIPEHGERRSTAELSRLLDFIDWSVDYLKSLETRTATLGQVADQDRHAVSKLVDDLLEDSKKLLLLPFATISAALPKLVRDLCREQGKEADILIQGDDIELDKQILEEMKDPLVHLLRNSVDHGIETPAERIKKGKPARATIKLSVSQINGNKVQLLLSDDGSGIDSTKVKASALKLGLISAEDAAQLNEAEAQALIFQSAVSTSPIITQLSGRGLGLAIVREKAEKLGGEVSVESRPGQGTDFLVTLPALRATFRGILVECAGQLLVVPTAQVERVARARLDDIRTVEGRETISLDGRVVSLVLLADVLELPSAEPKESPPAGMPVIVLGSSDQRIAFVVDAVLDEQEVLVKPLRRPLSRVRNIAATTVLGSGQVAPILNVADLLKSARKVTGAAGRVLAEMKSVPDDTRTILVVEDSITSRMLLKGILESVGYQVKIAVDGMEGFTLLRTEKFDLVVSDVEMPRLNGFDLTARIRADKKLAAMPVVLVTALESREDRERGIDVGASAYLVKSNLDQSNLLETVQRLI
jgi:two-component system chemotaxis sensor kinase CheA